MCRPSRALICNAQAKRVMCLVMLLVDATVLVAQLQAEVLSEWMRMVGYVSSAKAGLSQSTQRAME